MREFLVKIRSPQGSSFRLVSENWFHEAKTFSTTSVFSIKIIGVRNRKSTKSMNQAHSTSIEG
jgi:hypothetical protein